MIDTGCEWVVPIYVSSHDIYVMSPPSQMTILAHNETWDVNCNYHDANFQVNHEYNRRIRQIGNLTP